jgi:hypothetical protein
VAAELQRAAAASRARQPQRTDAPAGLPDEGFQVATLMRSETEQVRVRIVTFNGGAPFMRLQVWTKGSDGGWWPSKGKGMTVRLRELPDLAEGLVRAMAEADRLRAEFCAQKQAEPQGQQRPQQGQGWQGNRGGRR